MWYGVTLSRERASVFKDFLRQEPAILDFEPSECYQDIHIEFKTELPFEEVMDRYVDYKKATGTLMIQELNKRRT